jgi:ABC-type transporter MlaC component
VQDTAFGIIVGSIYSSFLQAYSNQKQNVNSEDIQEFTEIIMMNARIIKDAITGKT